MIFRNPFSSAVTPGTTGAPQASQNGNIENNFPGSQQQDFSGQQGQQVQNGTMTVPNGNTQQGQQQQNPSQQGQGNNNPAGSDPMLDFDKLWHNEPVDPNNPNQNQNSTPDSYLPQLDGAKLQEFVGKMDFTKNALTPELITAIQGGGEGATNALMQVINSATRQALLTGFQANSRMVETGFKNAETGFLGKVPDHVKDIMVKNQLTTSNPIIKNPKFGALVDTTRQQFQSKYPKATPGQIESAVNKYFDDMHAELTGAKTAASTPAQDNTSKLKAGAADANWDEWAGDELNNMFGGQNAQR